MARWHKTEFDTLPERAFQPRGWKGSMTLEGGGGGGFDSQAGAAQKQMSDIAQAQWDKFITELYPQMSAKIGAQDAVLQDQANQNFGTASTALKRGNEAWDRYEKTSLPALQKLQEDADKYNEVGYQEHLAQQAQADVNTQFDNQRQAQAMRMQAYGIDPTSGVAQGAQNANSVQQAALTAAAMNQTRQAAHDLGLAKQANLYNAGNTLAGLSMNQTGLGLGAGAQGVSTLQQGVANTGMLAASLQGQAGAAVSGLGQAGGLAASMANAQRMANAQTSAGFGSALGTGLGAYGALKGWGTTAAPGAGGGALPAGYGTLVESGGTTTAAADSALADLGWAALA